MEHKKYNAINQPVRKKDSMQLLLGKPVYVEDIAPKDALALKLLRSPHANAIVEEINVSVAKKVPGVVDIYTWEDVPKQRFAHSGTDLSGAVALRQADSGPAMCVLLGTWLPLSQQKMKKRR